MIFLPRKRSFNMVYVQHIPSPPLNRYIERLFYMEGWMPFRHEKIPPTPVLNLQINLGDALHMYESDRINSPMSLTESWLGGLYGVPHSVDWTSYMRLYGARFKPNGAHPFLNFPLTEVYNRVVALDALDAVWGQWASQLRERLHDAPTVKAGLILFERLLRDRLRETSKITSEQNVVEHAISAISRSHGTLSIRELGDHIGISQNHLGTLFKRVVGTSAKELARLYRFEHVLRSIERTQPIDWTRIAQQCGYYDLSHLNKDFVAFTGHSPTDYLSLHRRVNTGGALFDHLSLCTVPTD
jgi:AraC-like DNA-binding protein